MQSGHPTPGEEAGQYQDHKPHQGVPAATTRPLGSILPAGAQQMPERGPRGGPLNRWSGFGPWFASVPLATYTGQRRRSGRSIVEAHLLLLQARALQWCGLAFLAIALAMGADPLFAAWRAAVAGLVGMLVTGFCARWIVRIVSLRIAADLAAAEQEPTAKSLDGGRGS
jgi:hypothetical protein